MGYIGWTVLLVCFLAGGTLFFSVNAFALRIFSRTKLLGVLKAAGGRADAEAIADKIADGAEKLFLTCSLALLLCNIGILLLLFALFAGLHKAGLSADDYVLTFVITAVVFSIFGVAVPLAWAKYAGEEVIARTYGLLLFCAALCCPVLYLCGFIDGLVRRLAGVAQTTPDQQQDQKQEEFLDGLEQQRMDGVVDEEEQEMIENVLELTDSTADEIMTPRTDIVAVEVNSDLQTVVRTINQAGHTRVPVYEENIDNIIGFVYAKDLLSEIGRDAGSFKLRDKLRPAFFVPETKPLRTLLHEFQNRKLHIAVVLDEYGGTAGIVTLEDILEELVGEITDEYEEIAPKSIKKIDAETVEVDARMYVNDLNDELELNLPEDEDYDTVGGFIFSHLGYIPKAGASFDYSNLHFTVTSAEPRRVRSIRIRRSSGENADHR